MAANLELAASDLKKKRRQCFFGQRHLVALVGFLTAVIMQANRLVLAVGIAAMVKRKQPNVTLEWNTSETSCPLLSNPSKSVVVSNFQGEFDWSSELQGYLLGAGFLSYLITQAPAGWLADAVGSKSLLVCSNALSGFLVIISPLAARWHVYALILAQFLRGASQGITTPAMFKMLSNWIPRDERGSLNGIAVCGFPTGVAIGGLVTGFLCDIPGLGWPSAFYIWGTITVLMAIVFQFIYYEHPVNNPWISDVELKYITDGLEKKVSKKPPPTPWKKIFTSIPVYAYVYGLFGHYWGVAYFITVHPTFMGAVLHFSIDQNGITSCLPALLQAFSGIMASVMSHWVSKKNLISLNNCRKITTAVSAFGFSLFMAGILLAGCDAIVNVLCFALAMCCKGVGLAGIVISGVDMAPTFAGSVTGVGQTISALGMFLIPVVTGLLTTHETLSEWQKVFWLNFGVVGSSGLVYLLFGSAEVQPWNYPDGEKSTVTTKEVTKQTENNWNQSIDIKDNLDIKRT